jgi:hypothetical protein
MTTAWWIYKPTFTVMDVLETGACADCVKNAIVWHKALAASAADHLREEYAKRAANADGYGSGDGYGDGDGSGYGSGSGSF